MDLRRGATVRTEGDLNERVDELEISDLVHNNCKDAKSPTMEPTNVESQEPLLHDQTETSSKLKQEAAPQSPFHTGSKRPYRDSTFAYLFLTAILTTFTFGIIASTRTDTLNMDTKLRLSNFNPTTNKCEIAQPQTPKASDSDPNSDSAFLTFVSLTSFFALALTIPFSLLLLSLLRRYTHTLVVLFAPFISRLFLLLSLTGGVLWLSWCLRVTEVRGAVMPGSTKIFQFVSVPCILALVFYQLGKNWTAGSSVENGVEVLRMATGFLKEHFVLLVVNPALLMGMMVLVNGPIFTFMWYAFNVGEIVPDFDVVNDPINGCGLATGIRCCREERPGWVYAYIIYASFTAFWVLMVTMLLQHSVVGGAVTLWYFAPAGSPTIGNIKRSLRTCGPLFGTTCKVGTIITIPGVALARLLKEKLSDKILKSNDQGMMLSILRMCLSWMSQFSRRYPQWAFIFLGIWESSKKSDNLLLRTSPFIATMTNSQYLAIDALVGITLMGMTLSCTLLQTIVVYGVLEYFSSMFALTKVLIAGVYCFPIILIGLITGFSQAVSSVIDTVSVCYALEKDVREISKPEVCRAFMTAAPSSPETDGAQVAGHVSGIGSEKQTE